MAMEVEDNDITGNENEEHKFVPPQDICANCSKDATLACGHKVCAACCKMIMTPQGQKFSCPSCCPTTMSYFSSMEACSADLTPNRTRHPSFTTVEGAEGNISTSPQKQEHNQNKRTIFHTIEAYRYNQGNPVELNFGRHQRKNCCHVAANPETGDILVSDGLNHQIHRFAADGKYISSFGTEGEKDGHLKDPYGIDVNEKGDVAIADTGNNRVVFLTQMGAGPWQPPLGRFKTVRGVAFDSEEFRVYCTDFKNVKFNDYARRQVDFGYSHRSVDSLYDVCVDNDHVFASSETTGRIFKFSKAGQLVQTICTENNVNGEQQFAGLALDGGPHLLVCDKINDCLRVFNKNDGKLLDTCSLPGRPLSVAVQPRTMNIVVSYCQRNSHFPECVVAFLCDPTTIR